MRSTRLWFWITLAAAILCALGCVLTWVGVQADIDVFNSSFSNAITGMFFLGGFAISLGVDALILRLRKAPTLRTGELVVLIVLGALIVAMLLIGLIDEIIAIMFVLWPLSILLAIAVSIVLVVGNSRNPGGTELATAAFETPQVPLPTTQAAPIPAQTAAPEPPVTAEPSATGEPGESPYGPAKD